MSSYVYMKILESVPQRYDRGLRLLTRGHISEVYERVARLAAAPGRRVLDIGCGTGGVALACAARGAAVVGIDVNNGMLDVARSKPIPAAAGGRVEWVELGAAEIEDRFDEASFDAVVSCLALSELDVSEQSYALRVAHSRLVAGGKLVIADEMLEATAAARAWRSVKRWPLAAVTYALTQTTTRPVRDLVERVREAGFVRVEVTHVQSAELAILSADREHREEARS